MLSRVAFVALAGWTGRGGAGQVEEMGALDVVEEQRPRDGVEDALGRAADVAALEAGVVVEADSGELGDFLAPQARDPALAAEVVDAGLCGCHVRTPCDEELPNVVLAGHGRSVPGRGGRSR